MELYYVDNEGRYFFTEYTNWEGMKDRITMVSARDAAVFINKYGTDLHRGSKAAEESDQNWIWFAELPLAVAKREICFSISSPFCTKKRKHVFTKLFLWAF